MPRNQRRWHHGEDDTVRRLFAEGLNDEQIAAQLHGRTAAAVCTRRKKLGLAYYSHGGFDWTPPRVAVLERGVAAGLDDTAIGAQLGTTAHVVQHKRLLLGIDRRHCPRSRSVWTDADVAELTTLVAAGWRSEAIAKAIGRPLSSVRNKRSRLRLEHLRQGPDDAATTGAAQTRAENAKRTAEARPTLIDDRYTAMFQ